MQYCFDAAPVQLSLPVCPIDIFRNSSPAIVPYKKNEHNTEIAHTNWHQNRKPKPITQHKPKPIKTQTQICQPTHTTPLQQVSLAKISNKRFSHPAIPTAPTQSQSPRALKELHFQLVHWKFTTTRLDKLTLLYRFWRRFILKYFKEIFTNRSEALEIFLTDLKRSLFQ